MPEVRILEFVDSSGQSPFARWFGSLNPAAAARIAVSITRLSMGNFSTVEGVGGGVFELKMDFGPGYRVYFGKDGNRIVILLGGSAKKRQPAAIAAAVDSWSTYKRLKIRRQSESWR